MEKRPRKAIYERKNNKSNENTKNVQFELSVKEILCHFYTPCCKIF